MFPSLKKQKNKQTSKQNTICSVLFSKGKKTALIVEELKRGDSHVHSVHSHVHSLYSL